MDIKHSGGITHRSAIYLIDCYCAEPKLIAVAIAALVAAAASTLITALVTTLAAATAVALAAALIAALIATAAALVTATAFFFHLVGAGFAAPAADFGHVLAIFADRFATLAGDFTLLFFVHRGKTAFTLASALVALASTLIAALITATTLITALIVSHCSYS
jgi:hypothetical protein